MDAHEIIAGKMKRDRRQRRSQAGALQLANEGLIAWGKNAPVGRKRLARPLTGKTITEAASCS
jgi:hypothetical protein